jgi:hypothetical protein
VHRVLHAITAPGTLIVAHRQSAVTPVGPVVVYLSAGESSPAAATTSCSSVVSH